jgi:hypothetical protein
MTKESLRQTSNNPCPKCGSFYRRGDKCNICGTFAPVPYDTEHSGPLFSREGHQSKGAGWNKALHKVVRQH